MKMLEYLEMILGSETLLQELANALSNDALKENLEYIARMHDIDLKPIEKQAFQKNDKKKNRKGR